MDTTSRTATVKLHFDEPLGPLEIDRFALGQGGQCSDLILENRVAEIRALHPRLLRYALQEYFNPLPAAGEYNFEELDRHMDVLVRTGATPLLSINFKPWVLFPQIDDSILDPTDWAAWEELLFRFAKRYADRGLTGWYWEITGEGELGEGGGWPYRGTPETYPRLYAHSAAAILRADPTARVGGPALAGCQSDVLPALLDYCAEHQVPLHFVSWHNYTSRPEGLRGTIEYVRDLLAKYPSLHPETVLDEWNIAIQPEAAARDPRFQPCCIAEVAWQMWEAGLDHSCYYQIRDYHVEEREFARFFTPHGAAFMARWWNRMPQWHGLFDYQNNIRPSYFCFKLLSRLTGERLRLESDDPAVHGFLTFDSHYQLYNLMVWNFSLEPVTLTLDLDSIPENLIAMSFVLDAETDSNDENHRISLLEEAPLEGRTQLQVPCGPYGIHFFYFRGSRWDIGGM